MKNSPILFIIIALIVILIFGMISSYNSLISKQEVVDSKYSDLEVMLQRRTDLIPNLVNTVKGYARS